jgi:hypothetical protein
MEDILLCLQNIQKQNVLFFASNATTYFLYLLKHSCYMFRLINEPYRATTAKSQRQVKNCANMPIIYK